jgi:WD40 repeat protein
MTTELIKMCEQVRCVKLYDDYCVSGSWDRTARLWNVRFDAKMLALQSRNFSSMIIKLIFAVNKLYFLKFRIQKSIGFRQASKVFLGYVNPYCLVQYNSNKRQLPFAEVN